MENNRNLRAQDIVKYSIIDHESMDINRPYTLISALLVLLFIAIIPASADAPYKEGMPIVTAKANSSLISPGTVAMITGMATGNPSPGVAVWVFGPNTVKYSIVKPKKDSTYSYSLNAKETKKMSYGMYYIVVQHPMYNNKFDVYPNKDLNQILGLYPKKDTKISSLSMKKSDAGLNALKALATAIKDKRVDDTFTKVQLVIDKPSCATDERTCIVK